MTDVRVEPLAVADPLGLPGLERELVHEWLVWDAWVAGRRRVDLHPFVLTPRAHEEARAVAEAAWRHVAGAAAEAHASAEERALYGFHPDVTRLAAAAWASGDRGSIARVDLLLGEDGRFVACEVNADCPGGFNETLALPRLAVSAGLRRGTVTDPTSVAGALADRLVAQSGGPGSPRGLVALAYATAYSEDLQICALVERLVQQRGGRTVRIAPTGLAPLGDGVGVRGERVAALYRFYPLEWMAGQRNVDALERATLGGLSCMTSFAWIYAQSKLAMARGASRVFPETVPFDAVAPRLLAEREQWVVKRDLSRVGDHVFVGALSTPEEFAEVAAEVTEAAADGQVWIAQRYVPQAPIATPWGPRLVTLGVYLVDGVFAGYFARLSPTSHCSHDALVLPVFVKEAA